MDLARAMKIAAAGMAAQGTRLRVVSENLANADSTAQVPGGDPYRRKVVTFRSTLDRAIGAETVKVAGVKPTPGDFQRKFDPAHPAADQDGYVLMPNVNSLVEMMDMREAQRSYQANVSVIDAAKAMIGRTLEILQG
jgi:flagellar basal-body rod protein FlgC